MHKFLSLTKVLSKCNLGSYALSNKRSGFGGSAIRVVGAGRIALYVILGLLCLGVAYICGTISYYWALGNTNTALISNVCAFVFLFVEAFYLVVAIPKVLGTFFLSSDIEAYLPLPVKPNMLILAKLFTVVPYAYGFTFTISFPLMLGVTAGINGSILQYVMVVVLSLVSPILPLVLIAILSILLMNLCKNVKKKENIVTAITYTLSGLLIIFSFGMNFLRRSGGSEGTIFDSLVEFNKSIDWLGWIIPTNILSTRCIVENNMILGLIAILVSVAVVALFMLLANKFYIGAVSGMKEGYTKTKKSLKANVFELGTTKKAFAQRERKSLFRSTVYVIQCFIWPLLSPMIIVLCTGASLLSVPNIAKPFFAKEFAGDNLHLVAIGTILCALVSIFSSMTNKITSTCISREGKTFFYMRAMPIPYETQVKTKANFGLTVALILSMPFILGLSLFLVIGGGINWSVVLFSIILSVSLIVIINDIQLFFEARKPKLYWDNEIAVLKDCRGILGGLIGLGLLILFSVIGYMMIVCGVSDYIVLSCFCVVTVVIAAILHRVILKYSINSIKNFSE